MPTQMVVNGALVPVQAWMVQSGVLVSLDDSAPPPPAPPSFTDDFESGVDGALLSGPNWDVPQGSWGYRTVFVGNQGIDPKATGVISVARAVADMGTADMYVEQEVQETKSGRHHLVCVRMDAASTQYYSGGWNDGAIGWQVRRVTAGPNSNGTTLQTVSDTTPGLPYVVRLSVQNDASGNPVLTLTVDGVQKLLHTDTTSIITTGQFGGMHSNTNGNNRGSFTVGAL